MIRQLVQKDVKSQLVSTRVKRVQRSLDAIENGRYSEFTIDQCCDYISWLAKWKKVPASVWEPMCEQATRILETS